MKEEYSEIGTEASPTPPLDLLLVPAHESRFREGIFLFFFVRQRRATAGRRQQVWQEERLQSTNQSCRGSTGSQGAKI